MLYNYITNESYEIEINSVLNYYKNLNVKRPINIFIDNWLSTLQTAYNSNSVQFFRRNITEVQYYQQEIIIPYCTKFFIHFDICKAQAIALQYQLQTEKARDLVASGIEFIPQQLLQSHHYSCKLPLIIIDLPLNCKIYQ